MVGVASLLELWNFFFRQKLLELPHCLKLGIFSFVKEGGAEPAGRRKEEEMRDTDLPVIAAL